MLHYSFLIYNSLSLNATLPLTYLSGDETFKYNQTRPDILTTTKEPRMWRINSCIVCLFIRGKQDLSSKYCVISEISASLNPSEKVQITIVDVDDLLLRHVDSPLIRLPSKWLLHSQVYIRWDKLLSRFSLFKKTNSKHRQCLDSSYRQRDYIIYYHWVPVWRRLSSTTGVIRLLVLNLLLYKYKNLMQTRILGKNDRVKCFYVRSELQECVFVSSVNYQTYLSRS